jgi:hypothetical protein
LRETLAARGNEHPPQLADLRKQGLVSGIPKMLARYEVLVPHEPALFHPLAQLGSSQFGSKLVANCAAFAVFTDLSGQ